MLIEPTGTACSVALMMAPVRIPPLLLLTISFCCDPQVLSAKAVDPKTLAPEGTIVNAKTAEDSRAGIRIPYSQLIPTALEVRGSLRY